MCSLVFSIVNGVCSENNFVFSSYFLGDRFYFIGNLEGDIIILDLFLLKISYHFRAHNKSVLGIFAHIEDERLYIWTHGRDCMFRIWQMHGLLRHDTSVCETLLHTIDVPITGFCSFIVLSQVQNSGDIIVTDNCDLYRIKRLKIPENNLTCVSDSSMGKEFGLCTCICNINSNAVVVGHETGILSFYVLHSSQIVFKSFITSDAKVPVLFIEYDDEYKIGIASYMHNKIIVFSVETLRILTMEEFTMDVNNINIVRLDMGKGLMILGAACGSICLYSFLLDGETVLCGHLKTLSFFNACSSVHDLRFLKIRSLQENNEPVSEIILESQRRSGEGLFVLCCLKNGLSYIFHI